MVVLHVALRSAAVPAVNNEHTKPPQRHGSSEVVLPGRFLWKSRYSAETYASAVLSRVRAWWAMLGGVRCGLPDAVRLASAVWDGDSTVKENETTKTSPSDAPSVTGGADARPGKQHRADKRARRLSATQRRSGLLRCVVQLSRSLYGDAAALHVFRAACTCVTEVRVSLPLSRLSPADNLAEREGEKEGRRKRRRQLAEEDGPRVEQDCLAAVRVARVEHVVSSRPRT
jgi:hypothetical protein